MSKIDGYIEGWLTHRNALIGLVDVLQDKDLHYRPWEEGMSITELVLHMTGAMEMFVQTVKNGEFTPPGESANIDSIQDLKQLLQTSTDQTVAELKTLTPEQLETEVEFYGSKMPGMVLLENGKDHEIHHKGQLFTYARLTGAQDLPFFMSR